MEIKIRQKPQRSTGKTSLVLEYYYGYSRDDEGRIKHRRKFETLEYYLYTDPKNKLERDHNKVNLEMAEKVKAKRLLAEQNEQYGFAVKYKIRTNLVEYIKVYHLKPYDYEGKNEVRNKKKRSAPMGCA
ncbi:hypothetical protein [uncultured Alistipes sp.]|uniref:hypothetical protein n=1 Tax=uncultured Alistipes sp. TaxID=538949 RepID=UPI0026707E2C|nr:hypothetical protein [uncultured Alistipes sp.]